MTAAKVIEKPIPKTSGFKNLKNLDFSVNTQKYWLFQPITINGKKTPTRKFSFKKNGRIDQNRNGFESYPESYSQDLQWDQKTTFTPLPEGTASNDQKLFDHFLKSEIHKPDPTQTLYVCTKALIHGQTSKNNYYKILTCGKEHCRDCQKINSIPHSVKAKRLKRKIRGYHQTAENVGLGYMVITCPYDLRPKMRSKELLKDWRNYWRRKLKAEGYNLGFIRFHWCGEDGYTWKPHLNILIPDEWIDIEDLNQWKDDQAKWFQDKFKNDQTPKGNIYYGYAKPNDLKKMLFWARYITRATACIYNETTFNLIHGFRNCAPFGKWPEYTGPEDGNQDTGFETLPDGTQEPIIWKTKFDPIKNRNVPDLISINHIIWENIEVLSPGFLREPRQDTQPPPEPPPVYKPDIAEEILIPF